MSDAMTLALQLSAVDMMSGIVKRVRGNIKGLGETGKQVQKDFETMERSMSRGLKGVAVGWYALKKTIPGVKVAGTLQEAMLGVKMNLAGSAKNAGDLKAKLAEVQNTAITVSADAPFAAEDVVRIQNSLLKAGMDLKDVSGKSGAAFAATALASLSKEAPEMVGDSLARIGTQFKLEGAQYSEISDWLVRVDDAAATSLPELIQGLRMAGSNAAALNISAQDALTTLGALSPLGDRAGSSFNNFLVAVGTKGKLLKRMKINLFEDGKFVGMDKATAMLKERFGKIENDEKRLTLLMKIFGEEGGRAANTLINSSKGFKEIEKSAKQSLSMTEKMTIWGEGFNASLAKLGGTSKSTLATLFDPLLKPLTEVINLTNKATSAIGELAAENKGLSKTVSYGLGGLGLAGLGYGGYQLFKGGRAGLRGLKGAGGIKGLLGGGASTAAGIAKGKAIEAATGVQPVFVTNWPDTLGMGPGNLADGLKSAAVGKKSFLKSLGSMSGIKKMLTGSIKSTSLLTTTGGVALAGAAGYGIGTALERLSGVIADKMTGGKYGGSGWIGDLLYDWMHGGNKETVNKINLAMSVDQADRIFTKSDDMNTIVDASVKRGRF
ncbi:MAG: phage tail tape measure protein [Desulfobacula sp.]|nr:phage tail tape measure protein [Desulfobacula sp.]